FYLPDPTYIAVNPSCGNIGSITITSAAAQYSFDGGTTWTTNPIANNLPSGYYYIKIKNAQGCESNYVLIYLDSSNLANPNYTVVQPGCGTNGSITITTLAAQYSFDGGNTWSTNPVATNLTPGTYYYIVIKNSSGCVSGYQYVYIQPFYLPDPLFTVVQPICGTSGSITINTTSAQYSFDGGTTWTTNPVLSNLTSGSFYIMIKNSAGCVSNYQYVYINPFYLADPTFTVVQPSCGTGGTISISTTSAEYSFDGGATWTTNPVATNLAAGTYYIAIKNSLGCVSNYQYAYLYQYYLANPTYTVVQPVCGNTGIISITSSASEYSFDNGVTWTTNSVASNLAPGTYLIKIRNNLGCESNYNYVSLYQSYLPYPTFTSVQPNCSNGGSITITTAAAQYSFDNGTTWTSNPTATNLSSGYYYIKIKNALGCESDSQFVYINSAPNVPLTPTVNVVQPSACGATNGSISVTSFADFYSFDNGLTWSTNQTLGSLAAGTYLVKIKNGTNGCESLATTVILNATTGTIAAPLFTAIQPTCTNPFGTITITTTAFQYSFDNGITFSTSSSMNNLTAGTYLIKIKNNAGCISTASTVTINSISGLAAPTYTAVQPTCSLSTGSITINTIAAEYSFDDGVTFVTSNTLNNLTFGTYLIKVKNIAGCISANTSVSILAAPVIPSAPTVTVAHPLNCTTSTGTITVTSSALLYSFDNGLTWVNNSTSGPLASGTYFIKIKNSISGCPSLSTTAIINAQPNAPSIPIVTISQPTTCANPFGTITITSTAFEYSFDNGVTYSNNPNSGLLPVGNYLVKVKNNLNCESLGVSVSINAPTDYPLTPSYSTLQPDCNNTKGTITITTLASQYSFDNGLTWSTNATSLLLNPGTYLLKIKNSSGCESNSIAAVLSPFTNFTATPVVNSPQTFCIQQNATLNSIIITGQNIKWYDALTGGNLLSNTTNLVNGTTYYASQTINTCESLRISVTINIQTTPAPTGTMAQTFCSTQNATLANINTIGLNINWYSTISSTIILPNSTILVNGGTYYATQTINGCESINRLAITITLINTLNATNYSETICDNLNDGSEIVDLSIYNSDLISNTTNCTFEYYNSLSGAVNQTISNQITSISNYNLSIGTNTIYVRILSNNGCYQIVELSLILVNPPIITIPNKVSLCKNHNVVLNAGLGFSSYLWSTGATSSSISVTQAGNYSVTVTQNHGSVICSTTKNITVSLSNAATITQIETHDWTNNQNIITVNTSGLGNYEYSLDGIHYQDSNTFTGLFSGIYTVFVRDKNECGIVSEDVFLLMYPPFFTPNDDGYNDTWSIYFSQFEPGLKVEIIDRYGKLLKAFGNTGAWNGTYNGNLMPSDDYWFVVTRANGKTHKGHFAMKR
ncbi:MAG: T9SS type B sorting domain-containing protein, partial [Flavobacteriaceae bacterium]|nr:T9SS type B sorting domain-containing protein [Flavobacteriaceae bacterium]